METLVKRDQPQRETLGFIKPNTARVFKQLNDLIGEWRAWEKEVDKLPEHHYSPLNPTRVNILTDGEENIKTHRIPTGEDPRIFGKQHHRAWLHLRS